MKTTNTLNYVNLREDIVELITDYRTQYPKQLLNNPFDTERQVIEESLERLFYALEPLYELEAEAAVTRRLNERLKEVNS